MTVDCPSSASLPHPCLQRLSNTCLDCLSSRNLPLLRSCSNSGTKTQTLLTLPLFYVKFSAYSSILQHTPAYSSCVPRRKLPSIKRQRRLTRAGIGIDFKLLAWTIKRNLRTRRKLATKASTLKTTSLIRKVKLLRVNISCKKLTVDKARDLSDADY